jgi:hypothetical protein
MSKISKLRIFSQIILAAALGLIVIKAHSSQAPYLRLVGPPPLRFEVITPKSPLFIKELALPKPDSENTTDEEMTNKAAADNSATNSAASSAKGGPGGIFDQLLAGSAKNAANPTNAASDLLNVTPQMIDEYLKPGRGESPDAGAGQFQAGQSILVPAELGFVPPMPGESRAIYISK